MLQLACCNGPKTGACLRRQRLQEVLTFDAFVLGHGAQNAVERPNAKGLVGRNNDPLVRRLLGLQHDVTAYLVNDSVVPVPAKDFHESVAAQVAWNLHRLARTSSRTKWRRMAEGGWDRSK